MNECFLAIQRPCSHVLNYQCLKLGHCALASRALDPTDVDGASLQVVQGAADQFGPQVVIGRPASDHTIIPDLPAVVRHGEDENNPLMGEADHVEQLEENVGDEEEQGPFAPNPSHTGLGPQRYSGLGPHTDLGPQAPSFVHSGQITDTENDARHRAAEVDANIEGLTAMIDRIDLGDLDFERATSQEQTAETRPISKESNESHSSNSSKNSYERRVTPNSERVKGASQGCVPSDQPKQTVHSV